MSIEERVAILEERTRPKKKHLMDHVKEWGGVATLVVALLYTFPLGVWDRFYITTKAREAAQISNLRATAIQLAELDGDWAKSAGSIPTAELQTMAMRALGSKKIALLSDKLENLKQHEEKLTAPELILFAYSISQMNMPDLADRLYTTAYRKAQTDNNIGLSADILRLKAQAYLSRVTGLDLGRMRELYSNSVIQLMPLETDAFVLQTAFNLFEWAQIELAKGDWVCGQQLATLAMGKLSNLTPIGTPVMQYRQQFSMSLKQYVMQQDQPRIGCPANLLEFMK